MSKNASRDVRKRLFEFAKNEYQSKSPNYVEVRKAKGAKTFYRGPIPQLILTKYKAIMYTVFVDYGTLARLYYFNRDGYCINDTSYSEKNLEKIKTHLKKTSSRVLRYPKIEAQPTLGNIAAELDKKFVKIIDDIEKISKRKISTRPIITIDNIIESNTPKFYNLFDLKNNFLELPKNFENKELIEIALVFEAFKTTMKNLVDHSDLINSLAIVGSMLYLNQKKLRELMFSQLKNKIIDLKLFEIEDNKKQIEIQILFSLIILIRDFLDYELIFENKLYITQLMSIYLNELYTDKDAEIRFSKFLQKISEVELRQNNDMNSAIFFLASYILRTLSNNQFEINTIDLIIKNKISKKTPYGSTVCQLIEKLENNEVHSLIELWREKSELFPSKYDFYFERVIDTIFKNSLQLSTKYTTNNFDKPGDIILTLSNNSDTNFGTLVIGDLHWTPKDAMEIIGEKRRFRLKVLKQGETVTFTYAIIPRKTGTINFSSMDIRFNDFSGNKHFIRLDLPSLKIKE
ncbi:MAG: hypothetical protein EAX90_02655 [Candidatus Heimdallarchaeota archaeon]|nr:hypothetical protein [Candidatus Heimdallarchaeota archaeon]